VSDENWWELQVGEDGEKQRIPITEVGGTVRVAVGEPGKRSSIWYIHAGPNASCVYVFAQTMGAVQKFSLHKSGVWRYAYTDRFWEDPENAELTDEGRKDRLIDRWQRPDETPVRGPSIRVRAEDVTALDDSTLRRSQRVEWLPAPPDGMATAIELLFFETDTLFELKRVRPIAGLLLASGEALVVLERPFEVLPEMNRSIDELTQQVIVGLPPELVARRGEPGHRMGIFGHDNLDHRFVWDTAFQRPAINHAHRGAPSCPGYRLPTGESGLGLRTPRS
jgi:hypothetical protein